MCFLCYQDHPEYAEKRVDTLLKAGIIGGLIALAKTDSEGCKEFLSRYTTQTLYR